MNDYSIALFLHIVGALGFFVALALEWMSLRHLRRATTTEQVQEWTRVPTEMGRVGMVSMVMLLAAGIYMMATVWGGVAWITVTIGAILPMMILGMVVTRRRMVAIGQMADTEHGELSRRLRQMLHDPLLWLSIQMRVGIALGIVFLMTVKPDLSGSLLTIGIVTVLGFVSSLPITKHEQERQKTAT
jgi:hypothetical protein